MCNQLFKSEVTQTVSIWDKDVIGIYEPTAPSISVISCLWLLLITFVSLVSAPLAVSHDILCPELSIFFFFFSFNLVWCICSSACLSPSVCIQPLLLSVYWPLLSVCLLIGLLLCLLAFLLSVWLQFTCYICNIQSYTFMLAHFLLNACTYSLLGMNRHTGQLLGLSSV